MKKARELFGHLVPAPNFLHSAFWVGPENANDDTLGAIFVYGKYYSDGKDPTYIDHDGAMSYIMKLKDFKEGYDIVGIKKLIPNTNITLDKFIMEIKSNGNWRAKDYKWPINNCQHFVSKCIDILQAIRDHPDNYDWIMIPPPVLKVLTNNEKII